MDKYANPLQGPAMVVSAKKAMKAIFDKDEMPPNSCRIIKVVFTLMSALPKILPVCATDFPREIFLKATWSGQTKSTRYLFDCLTRHIVMRLSYICCNTYQSTGSIKIEFHNFLLILAPLQFVKL